ncbi:hypothetical protein AB0N17_13215 [Streptomyces sp. NPDC051133]|uniref:hypothetical protein n=1 Tax=Streptomyces sp. NPDC051133 TaxID=3155521 RepID=UPI0034224A36
MTSVLRHHRHGRALGACALSVALLSGGTAGAFAATRPSPDSTMAASITVTIHGNTVKAGDKVKISGRTKGLKVGTPLVLQHRKNDKWVPLKAAAKVKAGSSYAFFAKLNTKGVEMLRVAGANGSGKVYSPPVTVHVR